MEYPEEGELEIPEPYHRWHDALLYTVWIDDFEIWRPDRSLCRATPPGLSDGGRGKERLFTFCDWWQEDFLPGGRRWAPDHPESVLHDGYHPVAFTARLPGTGAEIVGTTEVALECRDVEPR